MLRGFTSGLNSSHLEAGQTQFKIEDIRVFGISRGAAIYGGAF